MSVSEPYFRSGRQVRLCFKGRRILLRALRTVLRTTAAALINATRVELAAHDGVLNANILHTATTEQDDRVFLEIVSHARNISRDLHTVREAHTRNLANGRVRLARSFRGHLRADTALKGRRIIGRAILERIKTAGEREHTRLGRLVLAPLSGKLIDGGHLEKEDPRGSKTI